MARFWDGMNEKQQLNAGDYFMVGNPETNMPEVVKYSDLIGSIKNANIPDGAILIQTNGKISDSGWRSIGHPMNGKLRLGTMDVIRYDGIDLVYGNSIGAVKMYQQAGDNVIQITPNNGGLLKLGRTQYGTDLKTIWMGLINANDVVDAFRNTYSGNYFYYFGSDHNYRKILKTRFGAYSNDAEFGSNTNYTYLGFRSDRVDVGMKANKIYLGIDSQNLYVGYLAPNIHIGGTNEGSKPVQTVTIYRGGNSSDNPSAPYRVFQATQTDTKIAGAGVGDMLTSANVLVINPNLRLRAGGQDVVIVNTSDTKPIYFGNTTLNTTVIRGIGITLSSVNGNLSIPGLLSPELNVQSSIMAVDQIGKVTKQSNEALQDWLMNSRFYVTKLLPGIPENAVLVRKNNRIADSGWTISITNEGKKIAQLPSDEIHIGKVIDDGADAKIFFGYKKAGDVIRVGENNNYYYIASDPDRDAGNGSFKVRVGEFANDIEVGSNASSVYLGHAANNTYIRGANVYLGNSLPTATPTDSFYFVMIDAANKAHRINKQVMKNWLGIA